jgi:hypothetical protein
MAGALAPFLATGAVVVAAGAVAEGGVAAGAAGVVMGVMGLGAMVGAGAVGAAMGAGAVTTGGLGMVAGAGVVAGACAKLKPETKTPKAKAIFFSCMEKDFLIVCDETQGFRKTHANNC